MIPKIIHQFAPREKGLWEQTWHLCQKTWQEKYSDYTYMMWDHETRSDFVESHYPQYFEQYENMHFEISRIDFSRLLVLHKYGGIYADMDVYCIERFEQDLDQEKFNIVESATSNYASFQEKIQNCIMSTPPNLNVCLDICEYMLEQLNKKDYQFELNWSLQNKHFYASGWIIKATTGPIAMTNYVNTKQIDINILDKEIYNPRVNGYEINNNNEIDVDFFEEDAVNPSLLKTCHLLSGKWGT